MRILKALAIATVVLLGAFLPANASAASTADLSVGVTGHPNPVIRGGEITWTITVKNLGPGDATGVQLVASYGSDASAVSAKTSQGSCGHTGGAVTFSLGIIPSGANVTATVVSKDFGGDGGAVGVTVSSATKDPVEENNSARGRVTTISGPPPGQSAGGTFCAPTGGVNTGGGGTAGDSSAWLATVALLAMAGLLASAIGLARR